MNKSLKTYEDGSELTVAGLGIAAGVALVATAGWIAVLELRESRRARKLNKKFGTN
jgi:hypothetical protein